jgi:hypothetical protein
VQFQLVLRSNYVLHELTVLRRLLQLLPGAFVKGER